MLKFINFKLSNCLMILFSIINGWLIVVFGKRMINILFFFEETKCPKCMASTIPDRYFTLCIYLSVIVWISIIGYLFYKRFPRVGVAIQSLPFVFLTIVFLGWLIVRVNYLYFS